MRLTKLTLAITFVASALFCACDDSSSAKDEAPAETTPTQTQSDTFTKKEKYTYAFFNNDEGCGAVPAIIDIQLKFGPGDSVKMTIKDPEETTTETGLYREATTEKGEHYYVIQTKQSEGGTYNYFPDEELIITANNFLVAAFFKDVNHANAVSAEYCSK